MSYTSDDYKRRAEDCVRLANATDDPVLRSDILRLRQRYLHTAHSLTGPNRDSSGPGDSE